MFKKILIANRGEIACRVIKTARQMGIATVAVYSEADKDALHVLSADEEVAIGPSPSNQSYLVMDRIIQACRDTGAEAVHPGYGFLSENPEFARRLEAEGIVLIGPGPKAMEAMGDKITSKKLANEAGVSTVPGHPDAVSDVDEAVEIANQVGYPVMLKASAGGGGKGMRIAWNDDECRDGLQRARNEAASSFGDDRVFIEKFIEEPRHIEIQVLADSFGNTVYLGERECSVQRRHQKVIEEAPSPFLNAEVRKAMGEQAVALARAVDYKSAGTVEFIVDRNRNFYFLEMNTRLQVEHPVTELVTRLDLVELMIRIAAGEPLPFEQKDIRVRGWAVEARVYAEDPFRNFLPSIGRLRAYREPQDSQYVRVDSGVMEGGEISMYYDPMIAKLITHGVDRAHAIQHMRRALDEFHIRGVSHNLSFLAALMAHPRFNSGKLTTNFIAEEYPSGFHPADLPSEDPRLLIAVAASVHRAYQDRAAKISGQMSGHEREVSLEWVVFLGRDRYHTHLEPIDGGFNIEIDTEPHQLLTDWGLGEPLLRGRMDNRPFCMQIERYSFGYRMFHAGSQADAMVLAPHIAALQELMPEKQPPDMSKYLMSPMPGLLVSLAVEEGQEVKEGEILAVVEAMKMENVLRAERDGVIKSLATTPGDSLSVDQVILEFE